MATVRLTRGMRAVLPALWALQTTTLIGSGCDFIPRSRDSGRLPSGRCVPAMMEGLSLNKQEATRSGCGYHVKIYYSSMLPPTTQPAKTPRFNRVPATFRIEIRRKKQRLPAFSIFSTNVTHGATPHYRQRRTPPQKKEITHFSTIIACIQWRKKSIF